MSGDLLKKLRYKNGPAMVLNAPEGYDLGIATEQDLEGGPFAFVQVFVKNEQEAREWVAKLIPRLADDAVFWLTYPKQSSKIKTDINRDILWKMIEASTDYRLVSNVAVDDVWSALRLRHKDKTSRK